MDDLVSEPIAALGDSTLDTDRSWAWWLGRAAEREVEVHARAGCRIDDVLDRQLADLQGRYRAACLSIGANDVRDPGWTAEAFVADLERVVERLSAHTDRVLLTDLPRSLYRPPFPWSALAGWARERVTRLDRAVARLPGVDVVSTDPLDTWVHLQPDRLHYTEAGHAELADRAAGLLGLAARPSDTDRVLPGPTRRRHLMASLRAGHRIVRPAERRGP